MRYSLDMLDRLKELGHKAKEALDGVRDSHTLEKFKSEWLGAKGKLKEAMGWLREASKEEKSKLGQGLNDLKRKLEEEFDHLREKLGSRASHPAGPMIDVTEPGIPARLGRIHPIQQVLDELKIGRAHV